MANLKELLRQHEALLERIVAMNAEANAGRLSEEALSQRMKALNDEFVSLFERMPLHLSAKYICIAHGYDHIPRRASEFEPFQ
jgi:hypothetical protein